MFSILKLVLVFLGIPIGLFCVIYGGMAAVQELDLRSHGQTISATITNSRSSDPGSYEVQYQFTVDGTPYSYADSLGRKNLWVTLPSQETGSVSVIYLPSNPWVNHLADPKTDPMESNLTAFVVGLILVPVGVLIAVFEYRRYRAAQKKAKSGAVV